MMRYNEFVCTRKVLKMHCKKDREAYVKKDFAQRLEVNLMSACPCLSFTVQSCMSVARLAVSHQVWWLICDCLRIVLGM
jgi:hypothetical protein